MVGLGKEIIAATLGEPHDAVAASRFRQILVQMGDLMAQNTAAVQGGQSQGAKDVRPQSGVPQRSTITETPPQRSAV
jgi:hypothetical protein